MKMNKKQEIKNRIDLINKGEIPEGYKKYHGFVHPIDWKHISFNQIFKERCIKVSDTSKYPLYSLTIENGVIPKTEQYERSFLITKDEDSYKVVKHNDFVYNPMNLRFGAIARYKDQEDCSVSGYYNVFSIINGYNPYFMESFVKSQAMLNYYNTQATGSLIEKQRVHFSQFIEFNFALPSEKEQEKIAEILSCCDKVIELKEKIIEEKYRIKNLIIQNELKHISCIDDTSGKYVKLGTCVKFYKSKELPKEKIVNDGIYPCIHYGQLFRIYGSQIKNIISYTNENDGYFMSQKGDVLMPTSDVTPTGIATASCINLDNVVLGGDILIIRPNKKILNGNYLSYVISSERKQILKLVTGVTVYHIYSSDMKNFKFWLPSIEKQENIVNKLSQCDREIELLEQELEHYKQLKKSLSQLLLTGIVRVNEV